MITTLTLSKDPIIKRLLLYIRRHKKSTALYIVGGYLRDALLKRKKDVIDIDFAIERGAVSFARGFARELGAGFVVLDKERGCARIVYKTKDMHYTLDFTDFRGKSLKEDMFYRDFTINTLALDVGQLKKQKRLDSCLVDFYGALKDIKQKRIRAISPLSFKEDPLRVLRAFSIKAIFGFRIDAQTLRWLLKVKKDLRHISRERIRDELFKILESENAYGVIRELDDFKILSLILPQIKVMYGVEQGPYHHLDVWQHSLETLRQMELLMEELRRNRKLKSYLAEIISPARKRCGLVKFACILHDIGKPQSKLHKDGRTIFHGHERVAIKIIRDIVEQLRLSQDEYSALKKMVFWHLRPGYLADNEVLTERAKFRYFRDTAEEAVSVLLLSLADQRATRGRLTTKESRLRHEKVCSGLIKEFFIRREQKEIVRLITGDDLIKILHLTPSPLFSKILGEVEEAQAAGEITTKKQALALARDIARTFLRYGNNKVAKSK